MKLVNELFNDEAGFVVSSELVLIGTILVIGMITGLATLRDGVIQELVDLSRAIGSVNQGFQYNGATAHTSGTAGGLYTDSNDYCELAAADAAAASPGCLDITGTSAPAMEDGVAPVITP